MNIGQGTSYQDISRYKSYSTLSNSKTQNTGFNSAMENTATGNIFVALPNENTILSVGGDGFWKDMEYADHSTEENPVIKVNHKYPDGTVNSYNINVNDVDPSNATTSEMQAFLAHYEGAYSGTLPIAGHEDGKHNFYVLYEQGIAWEKNGGSAISLAGLQNSFEVLKNYDAKETSSTGNTITSSYSLSSVSAQTGNTEISDLQEQLASLISGYDRSALEKVLENEDETQFWDELFAKVDETQDEIKKSIKENAEKQLEQQWEQDKIIRKLLGQIDTDFTENVSRSALLGAVT